MTLDEIIYDSNPYERYNYVYNWYEEMERKFVLARIDHLGKSALVEFYNEFLLGTDVIESELELLIDDMEMLEQYYNKNRG